jgi:cysteine-rich repeat protein
VQTGFTCTGSPSVCTTICGDGIVGGSEQCDDGNLTNGDGCTNTCTIQAGFTCVGTPSVCSTICGDGIVGGSEQCDDGNTINSDGCSSTCLVETAPVNNECSGAIALVGSNGTKNGSNLFSQFVIGYSSYLCG